MASRIDLSVIRQDQNRGGAVWAVNKGINKGVKAEINNIKDSVYIKITTYSGLYFTLADALKLNIESRILTEKVPRFAVENILHDIAILNTDYQNALIEIEKGDFIDYE